MRPMRPMRRESLVCSVAEADLLGRLTLRPVAVGFILVYTGDVRLAHSTWLLAVLVLYPERRRHLPVMSPFTIYSNSSIELSQ